MRSSTPCLHVLLAALHLGHVARQLLLAAAQLRDLAAQRLELAVQLEQAAPELAELVGELRRGVGLALAALLVGLVEAPAQVEDGAPRLVVLEQRGLRAGGVGERGEAEREGRREGARARTDAGRGA